MDADEAKRILLKTNKERRLRIIRIAYDMCLWRGWEIRSVHFVHSSSCEFVIALPHPDDKEVSMLCRYTLQDGGHGIGIRNRVRRMFYDLTVFPGKYVQEGGFDFSFTPSQ